MDDEVSVQVLQLATKVGHFKYMLEGRRRLYIGDFFDPSISRAQTCDLGLLGRAGRRKTTLLALSVVSIQCDNSVAFGAKPT